MESEATKVQRYELADMHGGGHVLIGSETGDMVYFDDHAAKVAELERAVKALATEVNDWRTQSDEECRLASNYRYDTDQNPIAREAIEKARIESGLGRGATT